MVFSEITNRTGILQLLEDLTSTQSVSSGSYTRTIKTRDINLAFAEYMSMVKKHAGTWQIDDINHTKYPNMKFNLVSGQQDYSFTEDEQGNKVDDIYRVECKDSNGTWTLLTSYNEMDEETALSAQEVNTGTPTRYYKTANGIFLDKTPSYNSTLGIRMFYTRPPSYFTVVSTDTNDTTEPGVPEAHHRYFALKPAFWYWLPKDSQRANLYLAELNKIEMLIKDDISQRTRDEKPRLRVKQESNK